MNKILQKIKLALLSFAMLAFLSSVANAQDNQLLGWQFLTSGPGNSSATGNETSYASTEHHVGVNGSVLKRASGLRNHALANIFGGIPDVLIPDFATAEAKSYYEFSFQPKADYKMSLSQLNFKVRTSGTWSPSNATPLYFIWKYSLDGVRFTDIGTVSQFTAAVQDARQPSRVLSGFQDLQALTHTDNVIFRLYIWGFTNAPGSGTFGIGRSTAADPIALSISGTSTYLGNITSEISQAYFTEIKAIAKGESSNVIIDKLISMINNTPSGESIHVAIYMINHQGIMDALKTAEDRGVNLHLIADMSRPDSQVTNATSLPWLQANLPNSEIVVSVNDVSPNAINHHKFALFSKVQTPDGVLQNVTFQTSHNFTGADARKIQDALVFNNADVYQAFLNNWQLIKANASSGMKANFNYNAYDIPSINTRLEFFPRLSAGVHDGVDNIEYHLNQITDVANAKIRIAMSDWSDSRPAIIDKLIALRNQGATIEVFAKDAAGTQTKNRLRQLATLGATVRIFNLEQGADAKFNIHAKMMLIEGVYKGQANSKVIITGSHNYTDGALKTNNEVLVTLVNSGLFSQYAAYFNELKIVVPTVQLLAWDLSDIATSVQYADYQSTTFSGLFPSLLKRGAGLVYGGLAKGFSSSKATTPSTLTADITEAISRNEYFEIDIKPALGKKVSIAEISAVVRKSAGGSFKMQWAYVKDGGTPVLLGEFIILAAVTTGQVMEPLMVSDINGLQNLTAASKVALRLYMFAETSRGGTFAFGPSTTELANVISLRGDLETIADEKVILAWSAGGLSGETPTVNSTSNASSVSTSFLTRGNGLEASSLTNGFSSRTRNDLDFSTVTDYATAVANNSYIEFSMNIKPDHRVSLDKIYAKLRRSGAGARNYVWAYSIDNSAFVDINTAPVSFTNSATSGVYQNEIDLSLVAGLQNLQGAKEIRFRIYAWGFTSAAGSFAFGLSENASEDVLTLSGTAINTLPVDLVKFEAKAFGNSVKLSWQTASETNNSHFEVLRSTDGVNWTLLTTLSGAGTVSQRKAYHATDNHPVSGANYYQLKQVDFDGKRTFSNIEVVNFSFAGSKKLIANYKSGGLNIAINGFAKGDAKISLYDISGKAIAHKMQLLSGDSHTVLLPVTLQNGIYILMLSTQAEKEAIKIFVQN